MLQYFTKKQIKHTSCFILHTNILQNTPIFLGKSRPNSHFRNANPEKQLHVMEPIYSPRALNTGASIIIWNYEKVANFILQAHTGTGVNHS